MLEILRRPRVPEQVTEAVAALAKTGCRDSEVRGALLDGYRGLSEAGGRRDPGCHLRTALLRALRGRALDHDVPLLVKAIDTHEYAPPAFTVEVAAVLRATGLVLLNDVNTDLAAFHACVLLEEADEMSAEPALTAARVLGSQELLPPLYAFTWRHGRGEVVGECLRHLSSAPSRVAGRLIERFRASRDEVVLLGLIDLLLDHADRARFGPVLLDLLAGVPLDVFRYGATLLVARREVALLRALGDKAEVTGHRPRAGALAEAVKLLPP